MQRNSIIVSFVGDTKVGKTTLINQWLKKKMENIQSNDAAYFLKHTITVNHHDVDLDLWDTAGAERFRLMLALQYSSTDILVAVCDVTNVDSFAALETMIGEAKAAKPNITIVLVVNKIDQLASRQVSDADIQRLSDSCDLRLQTQAISPESGGDIHAAVCQAFERMLEKDPISNDFFMLDGEGEEFVGHNERSKSEVRKLMKTHKRYEEIINSADSLVKGIRKLFEDYAHPRLFSLHWNRHHKIRADLISKSLPLNIEAARVYLVGQVTDLINSGLAEYDPSGSMAKRLHFAIEKLKPAEADNLHVLKL